MIDVGRDSGIAIVSHLLTKHDIEILRTAPRSTRSDRRAAAILWGVVLLPFGGLLVFAFDWSFRIPWVNSGWAFPLLAIWNIAALVVYALLPRMWKTTSMLMIFAGCLAVGLYYRQF